MDTGRSVAGWLEVLLVVAVVTPVAKEESVEYCKS
jgi:hypothetical protein